MEGKALGWKSGGLGSRSCSVTDNVTLIESCISLILTYKLKKMNAMKSLVALL